MECYSHSSFLQRKSAEIKSLVGKVVQETLIGYQLEVIDGFKMEDLPEFSLLPEEDRLKINKDNYHEHIHVRNNVIGQTMHYHYIEDGDYHTLVIYDELTLRFRLAKTVLSFFEGSLMITIGKEKDTIEVSLIDNDNKQEFSGYDNVVCLRTDELIKLGINGKQVIDDIYRINA